MDVPYNKSGASSRALYQVVRSVENAPQETDLLLAQEVERIRRRIAGTVSTSELRKDLIVLLYCLNSSLGSIIPVTLTFALPSAVHLAEAGSRVSEKYVGYLFCSKVMPRGHELELMLVNTVRKDLTSHSNARISLALEFLISSPSADVVPAVQARCIDLLSHPSPRIKVLAMHALHSLSRFSTEILHDEKVKNVMLKRLSDGEESVVRAALKICISMAEDDLLERDKLVPPSISLLRHLSDKHGSMNYSPLFKVAVLNTLTDLFVEESIAYNIHYAVELLPALFAILRRAVKFDHRSVILECFRLLGNLPPSFVGQHIFKLTAPHQDSMGKEGTVSEDLHPQSVHPLALIRHFLSARTLNEQHLFLSCLACLEPSLWAGTQTSEKLLPSAHEHVSADNADRRLIEIRPVLDQWEVERVLGSLESDDDGIRALTLRILISLDPALVEGCYQRALNALRALSSSAFPSHQSREPDFQEVSRAVQRVLESAFSMSLGNEKNMNQGSAWQAFAGKVTDITNAVGETNKVNRVIVEFVLSHVRKGNRSTQRAFLFGLVSLLEPKESQEACDGKPASSTLLLIFVALSCELAPVFVSSLSEVCKIIHRLATLLDTYSASMKEPMLVCMSRLFALLSPVDISSSSLVVEDASRIVRELREAALSDRKNGLVLKRCEQYLETTTNPARMDVLLKGRESVSLPEFALLLDEADSASLSGQDQRLAPSSLATIPISPRVLRTVSETSLSRSKLRYDAYDPPPANPTGRFGRTYSHSASSESSIRSSSRASNARLETDLMKMVTAGELTLVAGSVKELSRTSSREFSQKGKMREPLGIPTNIINSDSSAKPSSSLITLDLPFFSEPLVDVADPPTPHASSPYVSASTSLRTTPEPEPNFEELWSALVSDEKAFGARGWCNDAADVAVRRLQSVGLRMDVIPADVAPYEGDLKIVFRNSPLEGRDSRIPCGLLRLHEEGDGSCLWQVKCIDADLGMKVRELMR